MQPGKAWQEGLVRRLVACVPSRVIIAIEAHNRQLKKPKIVVRCIENDESLRLRAWMRRMLIPDCTICSAAHDVLHWHGQEGDLRRVG